LQPPFDKKHSPLRTNIAKKNDISGTFPSSPADGFSKIRKKSLTARPLLV